MTFDEYQVQAMKTAIHSKDNFLNGFVYRTLGMVGEAGEVAEKVKKIIRDKEGVITEEDKQEIVKEMGDVLWYLQALADALDVSLEDVAQANIDKLTSRKLRGVQHGSGDNR
jgi:NTP pyrophosphatase (non-canonical NTP hydrolase)